MVDIVLLAKVVLIGALTAAAAMRLANRGTPRPWRSNACWSWAIGAGVLAASGATDQWPQWPPLEDRARFLTLLVPLILVVETLTSALPSWRMAWVMRLALAAAVVPLLLYNSIYLADLNGHDSAEWSRYEAAIVLGGLPLLLAFVWAMLTALESRTSTPAMLWVLALDSLATALTVMLSGYFRGGLLGLGLTGAIAGASLGSYSVQPRSPTCGTGSLGMGVIGIFSIVLVGRFFGALPTSLAAGLVLAPLLAWAVEFRRLRQLAPWCRSVARLACVAVPLVIVVIAAQRKFTAASAAHSTRSAPAAMHDSADNQ